jgi:hypothetical protein
MADENICKYYTVLGERCSGTNLVSCLIELNFDIEFDSSFHHKHFFGFCESAKYKERSDETLFICVVRNVYEWIASFFEKQHHMVRTGDLRDFLTREIHSWDESTGTEIVHDWNYVDNKPYANLFELRKSKMIFCKDILPNLVKHHQIVLLENISSSLLQTNFLEKLTEKFPLRKRGTGFRSIPFNAQVYNHTQQKKVYNPRRYVIKDASDLEFIDSNIDVVVEKSVGYDVNFFRHKVDRNRRTEFHQPEMQSEMIKNRNKSLLDSRVLARMQPDKESQTEPPKESKDSFTSPKQLPSLYNDVFGSDQNKVQSVLHTRENNMKNYQNRRPALLKQTNMVANQRKTLQSDKQHPVSEKAATSRKLIPCSHSDVRKKKIP